MNDSVITVMCVDDHRLVRGGLSLIVNSAPDMRVVGIAKDGIEAVELWEQLRPNVTLMDLQLPKLDGIEATLAIRKIDSGARIIIISMFGGDYDIQRALKMGATAYLLKDSDPDELIRTIRDVHLDQYQPTPQFKRAAAAKGKSATLTTREIEVVELISRGLSNKDIAQRLSISEETVQVHVRNIFGKLDVRDRTAAVKESLRRGFIRLWPADDSK